MPLKLVLVGPRGTVFKDDKFNPELTNHLVLFIQRMNARGVQVALWSRHPTNVIRSAASKEKLEDYLTRRSGVHVPFFQAGRGAFPIRQRANSVAPILQHTGTALHETLLIGNEDSDLQAAVNNKLLLIRPKWYSTALRYGFAVSDFSELSRFCEIFALRQHPIFWSIDAGSLQMHAMGPFSTMNEAYSLFGVDARAAAKEGRGEKDFWFLMVVSSLYFSGLVHKADYICRFPGHNPASTNPATELLDDVMATFGRCFNKRYYPDLILRHILAQKSQPIRAVNRTFSNHLNTLRLNANPSPYGGDPYNKTIQLKGKKILIVDDICTSGKSLDVARAYIGAAGGETILFSWLKTISTGFAHMAPAPALRPFSPNNVAGEPPHTMFSYSGQIVDPAAPVEIDALLSAYKNWKWP